LGRNEILETQAGGKPNVVDWNRKADFDPQNGVLLDANSFPRVHSNNRDVSLPVAAGNQTFRLDIDFLSFPFPGPARYPYPQYEFALSWFGHCNGYKLRPRQITLHIFQIQFNYIKRNAGSN
jgi:hypothetical protein